MRDAWREARWPSARVLAAALDADPWADRGRGHPACSLHRVQLGCCTRPSRARSSHLASERLTVEVREGANRGNVREELSGIRHGSWVSCQAGEEIVRPDHGFQAPAGHAVDSIDPSQREDLASVSLLDQIESPADLRALPTADLPALAEEIRTFLVTEVCKTGGHLGPNLGVVELTIALHRVFDSPRDTIVFDTGHQSTCTSC